jgi:hypothetical protein
VILAARLRGTIEMPKDKYAEIERSKIDDSPIFGVVLKESDNLLMIHREVDFFFDGIMVVRRKDISKRTVGSARMVRYEKIFREEGLRNPPGRFVNGLDVTGWKEFLEALVGKPVLVENEKDDLCWLGVVENCSDKEVTLRCFDSLGVYNAQSTRIPYRKITSAQFGDRYTQLQFKYSEERGTLR